MYNLETHLALCNASYHTTLVARMRGYFDTSCQYVDYLMHCWKTLLKYIEMILKFLKLMYNLETHLKFALCNTLYHSGILTQYCQYVLLTLLDALLGNSLHPETQVRCNFVFTVLETCCQCIIRKPLSSTVAFGDFL